MSLSPCQRALAGEINREDHTSRGTSLKSTQRGFVAYLSRKKVGDDYLKDVITGRHFSAEFERAGGGETGEVLKPAL